MGEQNIYTFGKSSAEVMKLYAENSYCPAKIYDGDPVVEKLVDFIVDKKMIRLGDRCSWAGFTRSWSARTTL